ncbi:MAG: GvpL/GvpF family gas vesicle protein [Chloroflexi bacterium]|nr:GvpL/GvpF family gas vesicle protein [Chloroflexota bacterium]
MAVYLYGIMAGDRSLDLGEIGQPDGWAHVWTLPVDGLSAVVSDYDGPAFADLPKAELLRCLAIHQRVIERAMEHQPTLPAKFGTVLGSTDELVTILDRWHHRLAATLHRMGGGVEIEVAATWDLPQTFGEVAREPTIAALAASVAGRPADETVATRVQVGKLVKEALDRRRERYRQQVQCDLVPICRDAQPNPLPSDELVLNVAFLVERGRLDEFYARVHRLDEAFGSRLNFRCVGPLPPYSFATVEVSRPRPELVEAARRLLGLGDNASEVEVNTSYRRLAVRCHPDRNPGDPTATQRFAILTAAHAQVVAYLHGQHTDEAPATESRSYDLSPSAVDTALLMTIRRSSQQPISPSEVAYERDAAVV